MTDFPSRVYHQLILAVAFFTRLRVVIIYVCNLQGYIILHDEAYIYKYVNIYIYICEERTSVYVYVHKVYGITIFSLIKYTVKIYEYSNIRNLFTRKLRQRENCVPSLRFVNINFVLFFFIFSTRFRSSDRGKSRKCTSV